ncbi:28449_t:CDS:1 [Dentiscutata erythropus]|uniref:28449_t:CDS:1 n=1 Tax=Dentiscutata erythropus TaxID=1348616 RepID=A0A9N9FK11_9GLOM|nr:28449_t:CDS:1 [Dentiscutata erythropus]
MTISLFIIAFHFDLSNAYKLDRSFTQHSKREENFTGSVTFFDAGLGACGTKNTNSDLVCAISKERFGESPGDNPNKNQNCGRQIKVTRDSKSVIVTVVDICTECQRDDLSLTPAAFNQLADPSEGRVKCTWEFL